MLSPQETAVNGDADSDDDDEADSDEDEGGCLFVLGPPIELNWSPTDTACVCLCVGGGGGQFDLVLREGCLITLTAFVLNHVSVKLSPVQTLVNSVVSIVHSAL